jgi:hypothetical protein
MKKKLLSTIAVLCVIFSIKAQAVKFEKIYGGEAYDYGRAVAQTYDKGYVVAGATSSFGNGNMDAYLLKVDSNGVAKLHRTFGGINIDQAYSIQETNDTGLIIAGYTNSFGNGGYDMYVIKTDVYGDTIWTRTYGGTNWDFAYSIRQTNDSGYIVAGSTYSFGQGSQDMYLIKLNSIGDTVWTKTYGGTNDDEARSVLQTSDGGYILTGTTKSFGDINGDIYTIKTDALGDTMWTNIYAGPLADEGYDIAEGTGKYIIAGRTKSIGFGDFDGIALEISLSNSFIYAQPYGGSQEDGLNGVTALLSGGYAVAGYAYSYGFGFGTNDFMLQIQNAFNGLHSWSLGGNKMDAANDIANTSDKGFIICGTSTSYSTLDHIYLVKTDSNGVSSGIVSNVVIGIGSYLKTKVNFSVYPNPANGNFFVVIPVESKETSITIQDVLGREFYFQKLNTSNEKIEIDSSTLRPGIYFISVQQDQEISTQRIIIQH